MEINPPLAEQPPRIIQTNLLERANIPQEFSRYFNPLVLEVSKSVSIREHISGKPGDIMFLTGGQHGEETRGNFTTTVNAVESQLGQVHEGTIIVIPELNPPGCKKKTRYVFGDEQNDNLNNNFHHYHTGDWEELKKINKNKTAQLSWLIMYYINQRYVAHTQEYHKSKAMLIDIHREESVPFMRIDRRITADPHEQENQLYIEELLNLYRPFGIPIVLESPHWRKEKFYKSLTATCLRHNILGVTVEEGNTYRPEQENARFVQDRLLRLLVHYNFITQPPLTNIALIHPLDEAEEFYQRQIADGEVYSLTGGLTHRVEFHLSTGNLRELMRRTLEKKDWDGFFTQFAYAARGVQLPKGTRNYLSSLALGYIIDTPEKTAKKQVFDSGINLFLEGTEDVTVIDVVEPKESEAQYVSRFGFFMDEKDRVVLRTLGETLGDTTFTREEALTPKELRQLHRRKGYKFDMSILDIYCAHPDPIWKGIKEENGQITLQKRG